MNRFRISGSSKELFGPDAGWEDDTTISICGNRLCKVKFSFLVTKHHCRWCGRIFCGTCAPRNVQVDGKWYRRCNGCRLPIIFRSVVNPFTAKREATVLHTILDFLTPKSITALLQSCHTMLAGFFLRDYPFYNTIQERFPSYYEGAQIGKGGFGIVYNCEDRFNPARGHVVIKRLVKEKALTYSMWERFFNELKVHKAANHPNIARQLEVFQTPEDLVVVVEAGEGGTARQACEYVRTHRLPLEPFVASLVRQVAAGLDYLYRSLRVVHRDIKFDNIVFTRDFGRAMIIDFGLSEQLTIGEDQGGTATYVFMAAGTPGYASPENLAAVVSGQASFLATAATMHKGDLFSLGVMAHMMLTLHRPLRARRFSKQYLEIQQGIRCYGPWWDGISLDAADLVSQLLQQNPSSRPDYAAICAHPFIRRQAAKMVDIVRHRQESGRRDDAEEREHWVRMEPTPEDTEAPEQFPYSKYSIRGFFSLWESSRILLGRMNNWGGTLIF
ncbi:unnamed protein product [Phytomonas sp. EM1]|nr:unnamed protein product [Phytomonas sp. EM1]|eukprot:CCW65029.1 unnamed protein product [Phytomonas sp. isolate EM1]